ncbi:MAG: long-chain fatty acid--CoA ligase [Rhodospirillales bacterium]|nr:long-chain fatty acid--CoA ligase [Rhodospirillales bacterium]
MDLLDWIERHAGFTPEKTAIRFAGADLSYRAFHGLCLRMAGLLEAELGIGRGDRVALLGANSPDLLALFFACSRLGAIFVPLNWRLAAPEVKTLLADCRPKALFVEAEFQPVIDALGADPVPPRTVAMGTPLAQRLAAIAPTAIRRGGPDDAQLICYTSGTTGAPKGAMLSQNSFVFNAIHSTHLNDLRTGDTVLSTLPMFHVGGLNIQSLPALHAGARLILHPRFDPDAFLDAVERERPDLTLVVPAQLTALFNHPRWDKADLSSLRRIGIGSTLVPEALFKPMQARGLDMVQVYGLTETSPIATYQTPEMARRKPTSAGRAALHCEIRVVDEAGADRATGVSGEILVRGPNVMMGYWNQPEASAEVLTDGWFHTGDIGHFDDEGILVVDDRKKDMIISGGENIYPAALEQILAECGDIAESAVVGRADERWGEVAVAVVVPKPGRVLDPARVSALFQDRVARYKHPRDVVFVDRLPRNAMGKVVKADVRKMVSRENKS